MREREVGRGARCDHGSPEIIGGPGLRPVIRQLPCARSRIRTEVAGERLRDAAMQSRTACCREVVVQRVLDERVREREAPGRDFFEQRVFDGGFQAVEGRIGFELEEFRQEFEIEVSPDDGGVLERTAGSVAEPGDAPADHLAHAHRKPLRAEVGRRDPSAFGLCDGADFGEVAQDLADEEGIALGLMHQDVAEREAVFAHFMTCEALHELEHLSAAQPGEMDAADAVFPVQRGERAREGVGPVDFGIAVRGHDQDAELLGCRREVPQQRHGRRVGPMQVVEHEHDSRDVRNTRQDLDHCAEQRIALGVGARAARHDPRAAIGEQQSQPRAVGVVDQLVLGEERDGFPPGLIRDREFLVAAAVEHERALVVSTARGRGNERRLADPGFPTYEDDAPASRPLGVRECVEQERALVLAADEGRICGQREAGRERKAHDLRAGERSPRDRVRLQRRVETLQVERTQGLEHVAAARRRENSHDVARDNRRAFGDPAQSRRFDHGRSEVVVVFGLDLPERDPDAHEERFGGAPVPGVEALLHLDGRIEGGARRREHHHEPVAEILHLATGMLRQHVAQQREVLPPHRLVLIGTEPGQGIGGSHEIGEQHRDHLGAHPLIVARIDPLRSPNMPEHNATEVDVAVVGAGFAGFGVDSP